MDNNIKYEILKIVNNIPNVSPIEKVRWVYIKLGKLFSFDPKIDTSKEANLSMDYIDKYETCVQISVILDEILNSIDPNIRSVIIERTINDKKYDQEHLCNIITINDNEKYLLDLSLDLFRIHFNLRTKEFGYSGFMNYDLDIIPPSDTDEMDKKLGLYEDGYIDESIKRTKEELSFMDFTNMTLEEEIEYRMTKVNEYLSMNDTYSESNQFLYIIALDNIIECQTIRTIIKNNDEQRYVYIFKRNGETVIYIFDEHNRFYKTTKKDIEELLDNGWTNSKDVLLGYLNIKPLSLRI